MDTQNERRRSLPRTWALLTAVAFGLSFCPRTAAQTPDSFDPKVAVGMYSGIYALAVQADGKILVGGEFFGMGGQPRANIARLNGDGTLDESFNPGAGGVVWSLAVQPDGKILVGGNFTMLGGQPRSFVGRLKGDGMLDSGFNPGANSFVSSTVLQEDGKILVGGYFSKLAGQSRYYIGRLNQDGTLDEGFHPQANNLVRSLAVQADGKKFWRAATSQRLAVRRGRMSPGSTRTDCWTQHLILERTSRCVCWCHGRMGRFWWAAHLPRWVGKRVPTLPN